MPLFGEMTHASRSVRHVGIDITRPFMGTLRIAMIRIPWCNRGILPGPIPVL